MELVLWRHAEAEDGVPDLERRLTAKGRKQASQVGAWLDHKLPDSCRILVSPAARARETAQALGRKFTIVDALAPGAGVNAVLASADWPESRETVLVVGHQPTLGAVAALLLSGYERDWSIRKAGVWWLASRDREGSASVVLRAAISPEFV